MCGESKFVVETMHICLQGSKVQVFLSLESTFNEIMSDSKEEKVMACG